jgi:hypothetical protein
MARRSAAPDSDPDPLARLEQAALQVDGGDAEPPLGQETARSAVVSTPRRCRSRERVRRDLLF